MSKFNFSKTEAATENNFLKPGIYKARISDVTLGVYPAKKTPYLEIVFETDEGFTLSEKLTYGSDKASDVLASRIQYLHTAWYDKKLDKELDIEGLAAYLKKAFVTPKAGTRNLIVGGETVKETGKTYARLPFAGFIAPEDTELGEFEEDDKNWDKYVTVKSSGNAASGKKNGLLNSDDDDSDKLPFDDEDEKPVSSSKNGVKTKTDKKGAKTEKAEEEKEDLPWG